MTVQDQKLDMPLTQGSVAETPQDEKLKGALQSGTNQYSITGKVTRIADWRSYKQVSLTSEGGALTNFFYCPGDMDDSILNVFQSVLDSDLFVQVTFLYPANGNRPIVSVTVFANLSDAE